MIKKNSFKNKIILLVVIFAATVIWSIGGLLINQEIKTIKQTTDNLEYRFNVMSALMQELSTNLETIRKDATVDTDKMLNGSVFIQTLFGLGSGTIIKKTIDGMYILTCYHVISELAEFQEGGVIIPATVGYVKDDRTGKEQGVVVYAATIVKTDKENDLALLKTSIIDDTLNVIKLANTEPSKGDVVYSVGNPLGIMRTLSRGILGNHKEGFYFTDNTTTYGNSGGSLLNINGELIGVPSQCLGYSVAEEFVPETSLGLSIDLLRVKEFLRGEI
jgi:S1-C subfamily serine protease